MALKVMPTGDGFPFQRGAMAGRVRDFPWSENSLGAIAEWPVALKAVADTVLASRFPQCLFWGPELLAIYNDAFVPILGGKGDALGRPYRETWAEAWAELEPIVSQVLGGEAVYIEDFELTLERFGRPEPAFFTFCYSPARNEVGQIGGLLCTCIETTGQVRAKIQAHALRDSEQRLRFLTSIDEETRAVEDPWEIMDITSRMLGQFLDVSRCAYADMDVDEDHFTIRADYCAPGVVTTAGYYSLDLFGSKAVEDLKAGRTLVIRDVGDELTPEDGRDMFHAIGINAIVTCPLIKEGRLCALMAVHQVGAHDWTETEIRLVETVVQRCWAHIERIRSDAGLRATAQAMIDARNAADAANLAKTEFLANMSHEIRTPMNAIVGLSHILAISKPLSAKQQEFIRTLRLSADSLMSLINDLLDISKIEARTVDLEHIPFDIAGVVDEVMSMMTVRAREKGLKFTSDAASVAGRTFIGDPTRFRQVLANLCSNALKFTESGGVDLSLRSEGGIDGVEMVQVCVRDTGIGIGEDKLATIFDKFVQADTSINRKYGGTGLGLAICKTLVEAMGGTIAVESEPGRGSAFTVRLPMQAVAPLPRPGAMNLAPAIPVVPVAGGAAPVLLVEDHEPNILVARAFLEQFGFTVDVANNGIQAIEKARTRGHCAILMDVQMPGMNGLEAARRIREFERANGLPRLRIVGMTAHALAGDRELCIAAGMDDYLSKPFNPDDLLRLLRVAVEAG